MPPVGRLAWDTDWRLFDSILPILVIITSVFIFNEGNDMDKNDFIFLMKKTWFLIVFAGGLGYYTIDKIYSTYSYEPSQFVGSAIIPASMMYAGLIVGFNMARQTKTKSKSKK